jgi:hypothetical protein
MTRLQRLRDERGFTMVAVMGVMLVAGLFVAGAFAAADGDLPLGGQSRDSKQAYAAAQAGIDYYAFQVAKNPDFWNKCATPPPTVPAGDTYPIAQEWYGPSSGPDTRAGHWRTMPGTNTSSYAVEVLAAKEPTAATPTPQCVAGDLTSVIDPSTGIFRIRSTGKSGTETRSILASFRRPSFLDFLWFTNYENLDPAAYATAADQSWAALNCTDYRPGRDSNCSEITFPASDVIAGPFHSNDSVNFSSNTTVGRPGKNDRLETHQPAPGYNVKPKLNGPWLVDQAELPIPTSNAELRTVAQQPTGKLFTGKTTLVINGDSVTATTSSGTQTFNLSATNGVIFVQSANTTSCTGVKSPQIANYGEGNGCGNVYVSGTYSTSFTLAADNDIIVGQPNASADLQRSATSDAVAGLVAYNFVRVWNKVTRTASQTDNPNACTNAAPARSVWIDAAMLSVKHSFIVDNFDCGSYRGTLHVKGAIAQNFRGRVAGQPSGSIVDSGFLKDYQYDDRMKFRSPPYFLAPLVAAWHIVRQNEQVPAR